jgi:hypothetical protein
MQGRARIRNRLVSAAVTELFSSPEIPSIKHIIFLFAKNVLE